MAECPVYQPQGRFDAAKAGVHEVAIRALLAVGHPQLTVDCAAVEFLSSAGLRVLLMAARELATRSGRLTLSHVPPNVFEILKVSGVLTVVTIDG